MNVAADYSGTPTAVTVWPVLDDLTLKKLFRPTNSANNVVVDDRKSHVFSFVYLESMSFCLEWRSDDRW